MEKDFEILGVEDCRKVKMMQEKETSPPGTCPSPWDRLQIEGPWLHAGKNSRMSPSRVKAGLLREIHAP